jgi:hypothetical protein
MSDHTDDFRDEYRAEGAAAFKARILSAIDNIFTSELGDEEGSGYVLGPDFKPCSEHNMQTLRAWIKSFKT